MNKHTVERGDNICFVCLKECLYVVGFHFPQCENGDAILLWGSRTIYTVYIKVRTVSLY